MHRINPSPTATTDKFLPLRTIIGGLLGAVVGYIGAASIVRILADIALPSYGDQIVTVRFNENLRTLAEQFGDSFGASPSRYLAVLAVIVLLLAFPILFNSTWASKQTWSLRGLASYLALALFVAIYGSTWAALPGLFTEVDERGFLSHGPVSWSLQGIYGWALWIALSALEVGLLFGLFGEQTLMVHRDTLKAPDFSKRRVAHWSLVGAVAGVVIALLGLYLTSIFQLLFSALFSYLGEMAEVSTLGFLRLHRGLTANMALYTGFTMAALIALAPARAGITRRAISLALATLPAIVLVTIGVNFKGHCMNEGDMRFASLQQAAQLLSPPPARLIAVPGQDRPTVQRYPMTTKAFGFVREESIGASLENARRTEAYLDHGKNPWTAYTASAWSGLPAIYDRLLMPQESTRDLLRAAMETQSVLLTRVLTARLLRMPIDGPSADIARHLLNEKQFIASGRGRAQLATIAGNLGERALAERLWDQAIAHGYHPAKGDSRPQLAPPTDGQISGQLLINLQPFQGARVALFAGSEVDTQLKQTFFIKLLAAQDTDAQGRFAFSHLTRDTYSLAVLLPEAFGQDPRTYEVSGSLGPFTLTADDPQAESAIAIVKTAP